MIPISQKHLCLKHPVNIYRMVTGTTLKSRLQPYRVRWKVNWSPVLGKISSSFSSVLMNCAKRLSALMLYTSKTGKHAPLCAGSPLSTSLLHGWLKTMCCCWRTELLLLQFPYFNFWRSVTKSISSAAQCVTLHNKIGGRKVKICWFGSRKWFWLCIIEQFTMASKSWTNAVHLQKRVSQTEHC